jgi:hypothetical protein
LCHCHIFTGTSLLQALLLLLPLQTLLLLCTLVPSRSPVGTPLLLLLCCK